MSVNTYQKGATITLTDHFSLSEFQCKGTSCGCKQVLHDPMLSCYLEMIRNHFGKPVIITSGYRCAKHNASVGGASSSLHTKGQAADFTIQGVEPQQIAAYAESIGVKGIGLYGPKDGNFVHIDTRGQRTFWLGHKQTPVEHFSEPPAGIYVVTCRLNDQKAVHTLTFDASIGEQMQPFTGFACGVKLSLPSNQVKFDPIDIGTDEVQILQIRQIA